MIFRDFFLLKIYLLTTICGQELKIVEKEIKSGISDGIFLNNLDLEEPLSIEFYLSDDNDELKEDPTKSCDNISMLFRCI